MVVRSRGLSVLEVLIAMLILTVAALGIIATLTRTMVAQSSSSHQTVARLIAESRLQEALLAGPENWSIPVPDGWGAISGSESEVQTEVAAVGQNAEATEFSYTVTVDELSNQNESGTEMFGVSATPGLPDMGRLWEVRVRIWWNSDNGPEGAVERGTQELTVSKVVYIET